MGILDGIRIAAFNHFLMGPLGVQYLADLGADTIAIEPIGGAFQRHWSGGESFVEGESMLFACANRNKRSMTLDLRSAEGKRIARQIIEGADVVVENFRPGVMDRLGLGYEEAKKLRPEIIYASATGYGADGPYVGRPGQDLLIQALSGIAASTGKENDGARAVGFSIVDHHGAALLANGLLGALLKRERTGKGSRVEVSLLGAAIDIQTEALAAYLNGRRPQPIHQRGNVAGWLMQAPYGVYPTRDGSVAISLCSLQDLGRVVDEPRLAAIGDDEMFSRRDEISHLLRAATLKFESSELLERLAESDVWYAPVQDYEEVACDPQIQFSGHFQKVRSAASGVELTLTSHPVQYDGERPGVSLPPQPLGAQTDVILEELGYSPVQIAQFRASGIIGPIPVTGKESAVSN